MPLLVHITEMRKITRECVSVEENGMLRVNRADGLVNAIVERDYSGMRRIGGFVKWVIASDPLVVNIMLSKFFPEPDCTVLEVFVHPEIRDVCAGV